MLAEFPSVVEKLGAATSAAIKPSIALMPIVGAGPRPRQQLVDPRRRPQVDSLVRTSVR
jgi:hypothetical protein